MSIEHVPWLPKDSWDINGQKIAVVGYSHYVDEEDHEGVTAGVVQSVVEGAKFQFFQSIQSYFGYADDPTFWNHVIFFNFLPNSVGPKSEKYATGNPDQLTKARERFLEILETHKPNKVFIFTSKGWRTCPETTVEELAGERCTRLLQDRTEPNWGTYMAGDHAIRVCGFRHPQFARAKEMTEQVQAFLTLQA